MSDDDPEAEAAGGDPRHHRTIDRVTQILEEVVYNPGIKFTDLVRTLGAAKSSVHSFINGLLANGWLYQEKGRFYLGPAVYGLTLASGHIRAGLVTHDDLVALHEAAGVAVFLGVQAGDHLIYVSEVGSDPVVGFDARTNIRRTLLVTAGGKALLAAKPHAERESYLRRQRAQHPELVDRFLEEIGDIQRTRIATNTRQNGARFAIATAIGGQAGHALASLTLVGATATMRPRLEALSNLLLTSADRLQKRRTSPREVI